ncbi:MAG: DinB family protein [Acidobacteriia bacterium]|nr:DinB family protein [Terriglobia bacterium]
MQETPQQYTQRILGYSEGKQPLRVQQATARKLSALTRRLNKKQLTRRPAPGKWSIAEILAHLADAELVGGWRLRLILGSSGTPIQAFDQEVWAQTFNYSRRNPKASLEMFRVLRENNVALLKSVPKGLWDNYGMHAERGKETITHIVRMFAGHDLNHLQQVERIVKGSRQQS